MGDASPKSTAALASIAMYSMIWYLIKYLESGNNSKIFEMYEQLIVF